MTDENLFLKAFAGNNEQVPVWFMRQAGRFLPDYQIIREKYSLQEMFQTPELAAKITCLPIDKLGVDAAILFADILTLPSLMGFDIQFQKAGGPTIMNPVRKFSDVERIKNLEDIGSVAETIHLVHHQLSNTKALIGFAGGPFTVLSYLVEGGGSADFQKTLHFLHKEPAAFHRLMKVLSENTIVYLKQQAKAGIDAFQLFDTWAGILPQDIYRQSVFPYLQQIFEQVKIPSIYYIKNGGHLLGMLDQLAVDFLSICSTVSLNDPQVQTSKKGIQGNLWNGFLYSDRDTLKQATENVLKQSEGLPRYIFNLSHGIYPDVDPEQVKFIVEIVHAHQKSCLEVF